MAYRCLKMTDDIDLARLSHISHLIVGHQVAKQARQRILVTGVANYYLGIKAFCDDLASGDRCILLAIVRGDDD